MGNRTGIRAGWLVLSAEEVLHDSALICENGKIVEIVPNNKVKQEDFLIDARDCIVTPGFLNTHCHMYNRVAHGYDFHPKSRSLMPVLYEYWWSRIEDQIDHERIKATTIYSCMDMLKNGITCVDDILEAPNSIPGCLSLEADILNKVGMRGILSIESSERISRDNGEACLKENYDFILQQRQDPLQKVFGMMCTHTTFSCSADFLRLGQRMAHDIQADIQLHCSEGPDESRYCMEHFKKLPMEYYEEIGYLDDNVLASQCVIMDPAEIGIMKRRGVRVSHQPLSNSESGCGIAPVTDYLMQGIPTGLGTDGENNNILEIMRMTSFLQKAKRMDPIVAGSKEVFDLATAQAAKAIGYAGIGTLKVGMAADYVAIDMSTLPTPVNEENIWNQIVYYRTQADIKSVTVAGEMLVKDGKCLTIDEGKAIRDMVECTKNYWEDLNNGRY